MKYTDITSYDIASKALDRLAELPDVSKLPASIGKYLVDHTKLITIIEAMNFVEGNWKPDFHNENQKYFAWPFVEADEKRPSGFGFSDTTFDCDYTDSAVGSRLYFKTAEMCLWAQGQHRELFISNYLIIE